MCCFCGWYNLTISLVFPLKMTFFSDHLKNVPFVFDIQDLTMIRLDVVIFLLIQMGFYKAL